MNFFNVDFSLYLTLFVYKYLLYTILSMLGNSGKFTSRILRHRIAPSTAVHRAQTTAAGPPKKLEVYVDDKKVLCEPGMTILQVALIANFSCIIFF